MVSREVQTLTTFFVSRQQSWRKEQEEHMHGMSAETMLQKLKLMQRHYQSSQRCGMLWLKRKGYNSSGKQQLMLNGNAIWTLLTRLDITKLA